MAESTHIQDAPECSGDAIGPKEVEYLEGNDWEEGVVYVDEDGNEFMVEFVDEDADDAGRDTGEEGTSGGGNPLAYDKVQEATDGVNEVYHVGMGTARELAEVGRELKEATDDIKKMFDFKDLFKL